MVLLQFKIITPLSYTTKLLKSHTPNKLVFCRFCSNQESGSKNDYPRPVLNESYLCNPENKNEIFSNIRQRKGIGDIDKVLQLHSEINLPNNTEENKDLLHKELLHKELLKIPNQTHPDIVNYGESPFILKTVGAKKTFSFKPVEFIDLAKALNVLKNELSNFTGHRSYFFTGVLAELESALVKYSLQKLLSAGFQLISVPDILNRSDIERCGMETQGPRSQVYSLDSDRHGKDKCLSGTAEMALAAYLTNKDIPLDKLPLRLAAVSRCFRAETSRTSDERGIYRVHQFTKVEMFGVCAPADSSALLEEFRDFEEQQLESLGLHLRTLDMPPHELGAQAYRKYDIEAWLPGKEMWAELSSCSNCTDYQSRRLAIRSGTSFLHTVNGTAAAIPRQIIAIFETHQQPDGSVIIPQPLQPLMNNMTVINKKVTKHLPRLIPIRKVKKTH